MKTKNEITESERLRQMIIALQDRVSVLEMQIQQLIKPDSIEPPRYNFFEPHLA